MWVIDQSGLHLVQGIHGGGACLDASNRADRKCPVGGEKKKRRILKKTYVSHQDVSSCCLNIANSFNVIDNDATSSVQHPQCTAAPAAHRGFGLGSGLMSNAADACQLILTLLLHQQDNWVTAIYSSTHFGRHPPTDSLHGVTRPSQAGLAEHRRGRNRKRSTFLLWKTKVQIVEINSSLNSNGNIVEHQINSSEDITVSGVDQFQVNHLGWRAYSACSWTTLASSHPDKTRWRSRKEIRSGGLTEASNPESVPTFIRFQFMFIINGVTNKTLFKLVVYV